MAHFRGRVDAVHDLSLVAWALLTVARAAGRHQAGRVDAVIVGVNLITGLPAAVARVRQRRRDPIALMAPLAVAAAVVTTARPWPRWAPPVAVAALIGFAIAETNRQ